MALFFYKEKEFIGNDYLAVNIKNDCLKYISEYSSDDCLKYISEYSSDMHFVFTDSFELDFWKNLPVFLDSKFIKNPCPFLFISKNDIYKENTSFDRRRLFLDSSIWCRFIRYESNNDFYKRLKDLIDEILLNKNSDLYKMTTSSEFFEFNIRLFKEAQLANTYSAHANFVAPFVFHSEYKMFEQNKYDFKASNLTEDKFEWKFLLIDDFAEIDLMNLSDINTVELKELQLEKLYKLNEGFYTFNNPTDDDIKKINDIEYFKSFTVSQIREFINKYIKPFGSQNENTFEGTLFKKLKSVLYPTRSKKIILQKLINLSENITIQIDTATSVKEALSKLSEQSYDIILLDYLLGKKSKNPDIINDFLNTTSDESDIRQYGYEFLKVLNDIYNNDLKNIEEYNLDVTIINNIKKNKGPLGRYWIFPISSFSTAMLDRLREQGISHINNLWYLSRGADPINTPYLFLRTLNNFLLLQQEQAIFTLPKVLEFLDKTVLPPKDTSFNEFQVLMGAEYADFMQKFCNRPLIMREKGKSLFANSVCENFYYKKENKLLFRLVSAVQSFNHLCAYGSESDNDNMRYNLQAIKNILEEIQYSSCKKIGITKINERQEEEDDDVTKKKISDLCEKIRKKLDNFYDYINGNIRK